MKALLAEGIQRLLVVGSDNSSNSLRLGEVARLAGVPADLVGGAADLPRAELASLHLVGLTAGASAPEYLVQEIVRYFEAAGWRIQSRIVLEEHVKFDLPPELA